MLYKIAGVKEILKAVWEAVKAGEKQWFIAALLFVRHSEL